jgi:hypothetical protein
MDKREVGKIRHLKSLCGIKGPPPLGFTSGTYIGDLAALTAILVRFEYLATHPLVRALENARHLASDKCCRAASACSVATSA